MNKSMLSIEKMSLLSKINIIFINFYSLNLKYPPVERHLKYVIKYSIPDSTPILTKTQMYTQFSTDIQINDNNTEIQLNHSNNIKLKFDSHLLKFWLNLNTVISIEIEAIRETNKNNHLESKDNYKNLILWKGTSSIKCRDLICLPNLKLKSYIPAYKESSSKKKKIGLACF
ncbi:hypothetical protein BCR32DRAFT_197755 [Anaeromyces robustus]|uniref:Uncharacterized protein n=1 Tax=Anaeromyces robustus TaxID=1754192 RepID=A0A1Y1XPE4_9FUNG|nr:hypothetical protein BCR32DRAFT_197755 [Anaeromyces robustus]|eukprot:ORX87607.1 hypothetical protein BCR32DRAFT_197755 [Anaeromyces robustus]